MSPKSVWNERMHFYPLQPGVSCILGRFLLRQLKKRLTEKHSFPFLPSNKFEKKNIVKLTIDWLHAEKTDDLF